MVRNTNSEHSFNSLVTWELCLLNGQLVNVFLYNLRMCIKISDIDLLFLSSMSRI